MSCFKNISDLFPSMLSGFIFFAYIGLFVTQGILVTATKESNSKYAYSTVTVVMLIECIKLLVCSSVYVNEFSFMKLFAEIIKNKKVLLLYFVPAFLYSLYNNLTFINLSVFDPTTYYLLMQIRVVITGVVFQILFKKQLSRKQWISLVLLTIGCIVKQMHTSPSIPVDGKETTTSSPYLYFYFLLILVQVFCSCFAGVYNEYLLKDVGADVHLMLQNIFMYIDSIICNLIVLILNGEATTAFSGEALSSVFTRPLVMAVMVNGSACGIVTSVFLKNLNSILKTFAGALDLIFTATACWIVFGIPIDRYTVLAIGIVLYATYLYSQNPVVNKGKLESAAKTEDAEKLLDASSVV